MALTNPPVVKLIENAFASSGAVDVDSVRFDMHEGLSVAVESKEWAVELRFEQTYGFRVLDELDLTEFWPLCSLDQGWLYEVLDGGWRSLEAVRPSFCAGRAAWVREYLIVGRNECVSVLTKEPFTINRSVA